MKWDNAPVYRRRRRLVGGAAALLVLAVTWTGCEVRNALRDETPAAVEAAPAPTAPTALPSDQPTQVNHERTGKVPEITIAFAGDVNAQGKAKNVLTKGLGATGEVLARADLAMVNLETVVVDDQSGLTPQPKRYAFVTGPKILDTLKDSGVDVVTAANNHGMDYGTPGMERMLQVKASSPVPVIGIGKDEVEAWSPWTTEVKGRKVVVFAATDVLEQNLDWKAGPDTPGLAKVKDEDGMAKLLDGVRAARQASPDDAIVVYLHSGIELQRCPTPRQQSTAQMLSEAGADVVIGSHAHLLQTTTSLGNTFVAYGMGNFVFEAYKVDTRSTGVLTVTVPGGNGAPTSTFDPADITDGVPVLLSGAKRDAALERWKTRGTGC